MNLEALLAYAHLLAILSLVVFLSSEAALCRVEWLNAAVLDRLLRLDRIYLAAGAAVLVTGLARVHFGLEGGAWYWGQPLLHAKLGLFLAMMALSIQPSRAFRRWRAQHAATGRLPDADEIAALRRRIMFNAHLLVLIPIAGVLLARGLLVR